MTVLDVIIYCSGCVVSYISGKKYYRNMRWTVGDRMFVIGISAFSWIGAFVSIMCLFGSSLYSDSELDENAKW